MPLDRPAHLPQERRRLVTLLRNASVPSGDDHDEGVAVIADLARHLNLAAMTWVTRDMAHAALDASTDMPGWDVDDTLPDQYGLLAFEASSLPPLRIPGRSGAFGITTVTGSPKSFLPHMADVRIITWARTMHGLEACAWATADTANVAMPPGVEPPTVLPATHPRTVPLDHVADLDRIPDSVTRQAYALLGACLTMMRMPTVAATRPQHVRMSARVAAGAPREQTVTVVTLRRLAHRLADDEAGDGGRVYTHQWVVRGHWRQQRVGAGRASTRTTWVPSYLKGPEGAPLLHREHVAVWRR